MRKPQLELPYFDRSSGIHNWGVQRGRHFMPESVQSWHEQLLNLLEDDCSRTPRLELHEVQVV